MKETYVQMKERHRKENEKINWGFAFSDKQFNEMLSKWGLTDSEEDLKKIVSIGAGGFIQKKDLKKMNDIFERHQKEEKEFRKNRKFLKEKILYEMGNHEYCLTLDDEEIMDVLDLDEDEKTEDFFKLYKECRKIYLKNSNNY